MSLFFYLDFFDSFLCLSSIGSLLLIYKIKDLLLDKDRVPVLMKSATSEERERGERAEVA